MAQEVENPQRDYPRAMIAATTLVAVTYVVPLRPWGLPASPRQLLNRRLDTAASNSAARWLGLAVVAGGAITGVGIFNALVLSYTRLPMAMAEDDMLPARFDAPTARRALGERAALRPGLGACPPDLPFERLISIDLILYGSSLLLEFAALIALRIREPDLPRPFKAGNMASACLLGVAPAVLIAYALYASRNEHIIGTTSALLVAAVVGLLGPVVYWTTAARPCAGARPPPRRIKASPDSQLQ